MKRILFAICLLVMLPLMASAYTVVLKDGRRIEVRDQYRIVNDIVVFTLPEGHRYSISLDKINVAATELANGLDAGAFLASSINPSKATDKKDEPNSGDESPIIASSRPGSKKLTNSDFDKYRVRREEMSRDAAQRAAAKAAAQMGAKATTEPAPPATVAQVTPGPAAPPTEEEREAAALAARRELFKRKEEYWRGRARALLTQMRVEQEQIATLQAQIDETRRVPQTPSSNVQVYNSPNYPYGYPYPGIRIGGVPIGIGGGVPTTGGGSSVVVINNQDQNTRGKSLQERLADLQLQHQSTLVQYEEMCEEARRDGALPGWLR